MTSWRQRRSPQRAAGAAAYARLSERAVGSTSLTPIASVGYGKACVCRLLHATLPPTAFVRPVGATEAPHVRRLCRTLLIRLHRRRSRCPQRLLLRHLTTASSFSYLRRAACHVTASSRKGGPWYLGVRGYKGPPETQLFDALSFWDRRRLDGTDFFLPISRGTSRVTL